jgi:hypothetical protein
MAEWFSAIEAPHRALMIKSENNALGDERTHCALSAQ